MKAIILAAGRGSRMGELTTDQPKCMTRLAGKSLLERQLQVLSQAGIRDIGIVCGYFSEKLVTTGITRFFNPRWAQTNMVMSLVCAAEWLREDACVVSYADIVYGKNSLISLIDDKADIAITYDPNWLDLWKVRFDNPLSDAETFATDSESYLTEIGNRASSLDEIKGQYMGLLKFEPKGWEAVESYLDTLTTEKKDRLDMTSLLRALLHKFIKIKAVPISEQWLEVDNENDLHVYEQMISRNEFVI